MGIHGAAQAAGGAGGGAAGGGPVADQAALVEALMGVGAAHPVVVDGNEKVLFKCQTCTMKENLYPQKWVNKHKEECKLIQVNRQKKIQAREAQRRQAAAAQGGGRRRRRR